MAWLTKYSYLKTRGLTWREVSSLVRTPQSARLGAVRIQSWSPFNSFGQKVLEVVPWEVVQTISWVP